MNFRVFSAVAVKADKVPLAPDIKELKLPRCVRLCHLYVTLAESTYSRPNKAEIALQKGRNKDCGN